MLFSFRHHRIWSLQFQFSSSFFERPWPSLFRFVAVAAAHSKRHRQTGSENAVSRICRTILHVSFLYVVTQYKSTYEFFLCQGLTAISDSFLWCDSCSKARLNSHKSNESSYDSDSVDSIINTEKSPLWFRCDDTSHFSREDPISSLFRQLKQCCFALSRDSPKLLLMVVFIFIDVVNSFVFCNERRHSFRYWQGEV